MNKTLRVFTILLLVSMYFTSFAYSQIQKPKQKHPVESSQAKAKFIQLQKLKAKKKKLESEIKKLKAQLKHYRPIINTINSTLDELKNELNRISNAIIKEATELNALLDKERALKKLIAQYIQDPHHAEKVAALKQELVSIKNKIHIQRMKINKLTDMSVQLRERIKLKEKQRKNFQQIIIKLNVQLKLKMAELKKVIAQINKLEGRPVPPNSLKLKKKTGAVLDFL